LMFQLPDYVMFPQDKGK